MCTAMFSLGCRSFSAIFLTADGDSANDDRFVPSGYARILAMLKKLKAERKVTWFLDDYRDVVGRSILKAVGTMARFTAFRPETQFVFENYGDIQRLLETLEAAETDVVQLLASTANELQERDWWDEEAWEAGSTKTEIYALGTMPREALCGNMRSVRYPETTEMPWRSRRNGSVVRARRSRQSSVHTMTV
jgi:hypothetical protein